MNRIVLLLWTLLLVTPVVAVQEPDKQSAQPAWPTYTVNGEEFSVALPTMPAMVSGTVLHPRLQKYRVERHLSTLLDGVMYNVDVVENPESMQSLEDFINEQSANSAFTLTPERDLTVDGFSGKEYLSRDKNRPATVQFFAREKKLYRFAAFGADASNDAVKQFFSSITFGKPKKSTQVIDGPGMPLVLDTGERVYRGTEVTTKMRIISKPEPQYTEEARQKVTMGTVILWAIFSKTGEVTGIHVVASLPNGLTEACIDAVRKIKFVPATKDGQPVSMWVTLEYNFNL